LKLHGYHWGLVLAGLAMGLLLAVQFRLTRDLIQQTPQLQQAQTLVARVNQAREERDRLQQQADQLRDRLNRVVTGPQVDSLKTQVNQARILAGTVAVAGPGVEVSLNDSNQAVRPGENPNLYVLHDEDVLKVINELKAAGAEALSINGQRMLATSEIRCIGPTILTNQNHRLTPPFVIDAVGNPDTMVNALQMRGGVVEQLSFWGIQIDIKKLAEVKIPAYAGSISFDYARPAAAGKGGET